MTLCISIYTNNQPISLYNLIFFTFYCLFQFSAWVCCCYKDHAYPGQIYNAMVYTILSWYLPYFNYSTGIWLKFCFCICCLIFVLYVYILYMIPVLLACLLIGLWVILTCSCIACFLWTIFLVKNNLYVSQFDLKSCPWYVQYMLWMGFSDIFWSGRQFTIQCFPIFAFIFTFKFLYKQIYITFIQNLHIIKYCRMKKIPFEHITAFFFFYTLMERRPLQFLSQKNPWWVWILRFYFWLVIFTTFSRLCLTLLTYRDLNIKLW